MSFFGPPLSGHKDRDLSDDHPCSLLLQHLDLQAHDLELHHAGDVLDLDPTVLERPEVDVVGALHPSRSFDHRQARFEAGVLQNVRRVALGPGVYDDAIDVLRDVEDHDERVSGHR